MQQPKHSNELAIAVVFGTLAPQTDMLIRQRMQMKLPAQNVQAKDAAAQHMQPRTQLM